MKSDDPKIIVPDVLLTAGDIVGRAVRITRLNWLQLMRFFVIPTLINQLAVSFLIWDPESYDSNFPYEIRYWIFVIAFLITFLSTWELGMRRFALLLYIDKKADSLNEALRTAHKKMWLILVLVLPVLFMELATDGLFNLITMIEKGMKATQIPLDTQIYTLLALIFSMMVVYFPIVSVWVTNTFFISILIYEDSSPQKAVSRFFGMLMTSMKYILLYIILMSGIYGTTALPVILTIPVSLILPKTLGFGIFEETFNSLVETPVYCFIGACITIGGAILYKQISYRHSGQDLLDRLEALK